MTNRRGWALLAAWVVLLGAGVAWIQHRLVISADLRLFMPEPRTEAQRLLLQNVGESPASRLLLVTIGGAEPAVLARISKNLRDALRTHSEFELVTNGGSSFAPVGDLLEYRYLVTDSFDTRPLDAQRLSDELAERVADLSSPAAVMLEDWLPRDPTLEALHLMARWQPRFEPRLVDGVWFSADGTRALLMVESRAAAFDPDGQTRALDVLRSEFERLRQPWPATIEVTGPGYFSSIIKARTQREASGFGGAATLGLITLMWFAYRRLGFTLLGALPLGSAALAGLAAVSAVFTSVHGITLAFGFTLIGVAQDYPMHLFSHLERGKPALQTARHVWPPLATGVASTCIAYLAFLVSGVTGLAQLACLTVVGLAVAGLTTRFLLPRVVPEPVRDPADSRRLGRLDARFAALPRPWWLLVIIPLLAAVILAWRAEGFWQNDLSKLTPVPAELLRKDQELRREMATPDLRYLLVASGDSDQDVLQAMERLDPALAAGVRDAALESFDHAARYLPSVERQRARQAALPDEPALLSILESATADQPFDEHLFDPFVEDVRRSKSAAPITRADFDDTPLRALRSVVDDLLFERAGRWYGLVNLYGVHDPAAVQRLAEAPGGKVTFLDLKAASESLVAAQRSYIVNCLGIAAISLVLVIGIALRRVSRVARVLAPMVLTTLVILAVLRAAGVPLNLFHLVSLVLAAGLGLDYALFFEHAASDPAQQKRTLHALLVCSISTLLVFALLSLSTVPVLQAIGITVSLGVVSNFVLALLLTRERARS